MLSFALGAYLVSLPSSFGFTLDPKGPRDLPGASGFPGVGQRLSRVGLIVMVSVYPNGQKTLDTDFGMTLPKVTSRDREYLTLQQQTGPVSSVSVGYFVGDTRVWVNYSSDANPTIADAVALVDHITVTANPSTTSSTVHAAPPPTS